MYDSNTEAKFDVLLHSCNSHCSYFLQPWQEELRTAYRETRRKRRAKREAADDALRRKKKRRERSEKWQASGLGVGPPSDGGVASDSEHDVGPKPPASPPPEAESKPPPPRWQSTDGTPPPSTQAHTDTH